MHEMGLIALSSRQSTSIPWKEQPGYPLPAEVFKDTGVEISVDGRSSLMERISPYFSGCCLTNGLSIKQ